MDKTKKEIILTHIRNTGFTTVLGALYFLIAHIGADTPFGCLSMLGYMSAFCAITSVGLGIIELINK